MTGLTLNVCHRVDIVAGQRQRLSDVFWKQRLNYKQAKLLPVLIENTLTNIYNLKSFYKTVVCSTMCFNGRFFHRTVIRHVFFYLGIVFTLQCISVAVFSPSLSQLVRNRKNGEDHNAQNYTTLCFGKCKIALKFRTNSSELFGTVTYRLSCCYRNPTFNLERALNEDIGNPTYLSDSSVLFAHFYSNVVWWAWHPIT